MEWINDEYGFRAANHRAVSGSRPVDDPIEVLPNGPHDAAVFAIHRDAMPKFRRPNRNNRASKYNQGRALPHKVFQLLEVEAQQQHLHNNGRRHNSPRTSIPKTRRLALLP